MIETDAPTPPPPPAPLAPPRNPARSVAIWVILLLLVLAVLYGLSDRLAPASSRGSVSAHVVQIAPRVAGEVTAVNVDDDAVVQAGDPLF